MENVEGQILQTILKNEPRKLLPEKTCALIFHQLISALSFCKELNVAHRDIKPDNIMVNMSDPRCPTKLIDFGFAAQSTTKMQIFCGTPAFMSPEICASEKYDGPAADMWATGILLYICLFG